MYSMKYYSSGKLIEIDIVHARKNAHSADITYSYYYNLAAMRLMLIVIWVPSQDRGHCLN